MTMLFWYRNCADRRQQESPAKLQSQIENNNFKKNASNILFFLYICRPLKLFLSLLFDY